MPGAKEVTKAVLDASVAVRWLVMEEGSKQAATLLELPIAWLAPHLLVTEVAAALRRKVVGSEIRPEQAVQATDILVSAIDDGVIELMGDEHIVAAALSLALATQHKLPHCLYLALAERESAALATADDTLRRLAKRQGVALLGNEP